MNKLTDKDLCEALKRKEARREKPQVPEDFLDNIMQEIAPKPVKKVRYTYIAALAAAACILFLIAFRLWNIEQPAPSEPTQRIVAEKGTVTPNKEKKAETGTQVLPKKVVAYQAPKASKKSVIQHNTVTTTDSLDYYISKIERELTQVDDSLYIERIHRVMHADERLQRIVNNYLLNELHQHVKASEANNINNVKTDEYEK